MSDVFDERAAEAAAALKGLEAPAKEAADAIDTAFARAGESMARSLGRAAADGKVSLKELVSAIVSAVEAAAGGTGGLGDALARVLSSGFSGGFGGARADGGFVAPGAAYVVGERGPEVFRPATAGVVESAAPAPAVNVTVVVPGGAAALVRSEAQVASMLARAVRLGVR